MGYQKMFAAKRWDVDRERARSGAWILASAPPEVIFKYYFNPRSGNKLNNTERIRDFHARINFAMHHFPPARCTQTLGNSHEKFLQLPGNVTRIPPRWNCRAIKLTYLKSLIKYRTVHSSRSEANFQLFRDLLGFSVRKHFRIRRTVISETLI